MRGFSLLSQQNLVKLICASRRDVFMHLLNTATKKTSKHSFCCFEVIFFLFMGNHFFSSIPSKAMLLKMILN